MLTHNNKVDSPCTVLFGDAQISFTVVDVSNSEATSSFCETTLTFVCSNEVSDLRGVVDDDTFMESTLPTRTVCNLNDYIFT